MNTSTGVVEWEIRLPCGHSVGSSCIVTWLRDNNSCPACRKTFFPAQPRPYLEHGIFEVDRPWTVRIPTGPEVPTGSLTGNPGASGSRPVRIPTGPEVPTGSLTGNPGASGSRPVRIPTGPEVPTGSLPRGPDAGRSEPVRVLRAPVAPAGQRPRERSLTSNERSLIRAMTTVAESMGFLMRQRLQYLDEQSIAAVCVYMAVHLLRRPLTPEQISSIGGLSLDRIRATYLQLYAIRTQFIDPRVLELIAGNHVEGLLAFLPPPDGEDIIVNAEEERRNFQHQANIQRLVLEKTYLYEHCLRLFENLGNPNVYFISVEISRRALSEGSLGLLSLPMKVAIGLYMAAHLVGFPMSPQRITHLLIINEDSFKAAYARAYAVRYQLITPSMLRWVGLESMPRAFRAMPALNWPRL